MVYFRGSRQALKDSLSQVPRKLMDGPGGADLKLRIAMVALSLIRQAFVIKSRGGTDEAGERWEPLAESTVMSRRAGPETRRSLAISRRTERLSDEQKRAYRREYRERKASLEYSGVEPAQASSLARAQATRVVQGMGGDVRTRWEILGARQVDILRDTGMLLNSLTPVIVPGTDEIAIGTNVPYAVYHHFGTQDIAQRRLWPEVEHWPDSWWEQILAEARRGAEELMVRGEL